MALTYLLSASELGLSVTAALALKASRDAVGLAVLSLSVKHAATGWRSCRKVDRSDSPSTFHRYKSPAAQLADHCGAPSAPTLRFIFHCGVPNGLCCRPVAINGTYRPDPRRLRDLAYWALCLLLVSEATALAQVENKAAAPSNAILGRWSSTKNCRKPDFVFDTKSATVVLNADGNVQPYRFGKVEYVASQPNQITVNFNEPHGFSISKSDKAITVKLEAPGTASILADRKGANLMLTKCP